MQNLIEQTPLTFTTLNMPPASHKIEARIAKAYKAIDNNPKLKGIATTIQFGALYYRLIARRRGRPPSYTRGRYNKKLFIL
jgi:hypothetical protein